MIVVSHPRSGATKFCLDLERETGKKFEGELAPCYMEGLGGLYQEKAASHETGFQPTYTRKKWLDLLKLPNEKILLANRFGVLLADQAEVIVLREDFMASLMSMTDLLYKFSGTTVGGALTWTRAMIQETYGLLTYCCESNKEIVWFEDLYPNHKQKLKNLDEDGVSFYKNIYRDYLSQTPISKQIKFLRTRNN